MTSTCRRWIMRSVLLLIIMMPQLYANFETRLAHAAEHADAVLSGKGHAPPKKSEEMSKMFKGKVVEVINAGRQVYLRIDSGEEFVWVAVPAFEGRVGDRVLVPPGVPVADYHSRKLNRDFDEVYFVGTVRRLDNDETEQTP